MLSESLGKRDRARDKLRWVWLMLMAMLAEPPGAAADAPLDARAARLRGPEPAGDVSLRDRTGTYALAASRLWGVSGRGLLQGVLDRVAELGSGVPLCRRLLEGEERPLPGLPRVGS